MEKKDKYLEYTPYSPPVPKYFISVPSELITAKELNDKRISCFYYLNQNITYENTVMYCFNYMAKFCKYKAQWNRNQQNNIHSKFLECMKWFHDNGYIIDFNSDKFIGQTFQCSPVDINKIRKPERFAKIYDFEIEKIINFKSDYRPLSSSILLLTLSYLRLKTWNRKDEITGYSESSKKDKPEICHKKYIEIAQEIGLSEKIVSRAIHTLSSFGFIAVRPMPRFRDENNYWVVDDTIFITPYKFIQKQDGEFTLASKEFYDFRKEISYGISFIKEQKYTSKKFYQE